MENFIFDLSILLVGSAILSFIAVFFKQPVIMAYIACGLLAGPWALGLIKNPEFIDGVSHIGITLLLFLAGLCLHPQKIIGLFKQTLLVTLINCACSFLIAFGLSLAFYFSFMDSLCIALALMFSSTILVVKLLPTTTLHQQRMGAICISVLIMQDLLAVGVITFIKSLHISELALSGVAFFFLKLLVLLGLLIAFEFIVLRRVLRFVDRTHEALFVVGLAWCFGVASISNAMGIFYETGAFFAGVILARHKIAFFISEKFKPIRDFFLVLFFFTLGAKLDVIVMKDILLPALVFALIFLFVKPWIFKKSFVLSGEKGSFAKELGFRLGQLSEFSLLIALLAFESGKISDSASQLIQLVTIFTFIVSCYVVVFKYHTPIGIRKRKD